MHYWLYLNEMEEEQLVGIARAAEIASGIADEERRAKSLKGLADSLGARGEFSAALRLARTLQDATRIHAFVYAFNTVGAFCGALAAGPAVEALGAVGVAALG